MVSPASPDRVYCLVIDPNLADRQMTVEALERAGPSLVVREAATAEEAVGTLGEFATLRRQGARMLIIIDPGLSRDAGWRVMQSIRQHSVLGAVPVIAYTTIEDQVNIEHAHVQGVNCYVVKPMTVDQYRDAVAAIVRFWLDMAQLPVMREARDEPVRLHSTTPWSAQLQPPVRPDRSV